MMTFPHWFPGKSARALTENGFTAMLGSSSKSAGVISTSREDQMKIVSLLGSPRESGSSSAIARRFCSSAEALGGEVKTFALNKLRFRGRRGCMLCMT
jgi:hypothetical protein